MQVVVRTVVFSEEEKAALVRGQKTLSLEGGEATGKICPRGDKSLRGCQVVVGFVLGSGTPCDLRVHGGPDFSAARGVPWGLT